MFQPKVVEKIKSHILGSIIIFLRQSWLHQIVCKNIVCVRTGHRWQYRAFHDVLSDYNHL